MGEPELLAVLGLLLQHLAEHMARGVDLDVVEALAAPQALVQRVLDAGLAHEVAHGQLRILRQLGLVGFGYVAQNVGEEVLLGVAALGEDHDLEAGPGVELGLDAHDEAVVEIRDEQERLEAFHLVFALAVALLDLL